MPHFSALVACGCYALDRAHVRSRTVCTTTAPTSAYRGAGRPGGRLPARADDGPAGPAAAAGPGGAAATELPAAERLPAHHPHRRAVRQRRLPAGVRTHAGTAGLRRRARRTATCGEARDRLLGVGVACYVERSGGGSRTARSTGRSRSPGPARWSPTPVPRRPARVTRRSFPQVVAEVLGVDVDRVRLVERDTREVREGHGTFGSRSMQVGGGALWRAGETLIRLARERGAARWRCRLRTSATTAARSVAVSEQSDAGRTRPADRAAARRGRVHAAAGVPVRLLRRGGRDRPRRWAPSTCGSWWRSTTTAWSSTRWWSTGQTIGSIAQGLGQALYEVAWYHSDGRAGDRTMLDYLVPTAAEMPPLVLEETRDARTRTSRSAPREPARRAASARRRRCSTPSPTRSISTVPSGRIFRRRRDLVWSLLHGREARTKSAAPTTPVTFGRSSSAQD